METKSSSEGTPDEPSELAETPVLERRSQLNRYAWLIILAVIVVIFYGCWRIIQDQRTLNQLQQTNRALQEDVVETKQELEITAGQLDLALNAVSLARIHRDDGQKELREMENRLAETRASLEALQGRVQDYQTQIETLGKAQQAMRAALAEATRLPDYRYTGSFEQAAEYAASTSPSQSIFLLRMAGDIGAIKWKFEGNNPEEGFDSIGLAAYLLVKCGLAPEPVAEARNQLTEILEEVTEPAVGDLVHYQDDYYMFYFLDQNGTSFVAGMTPYGIELFDFDFKEVEGIYHVTYEDEMQCNLISNP